MDFQVEAKSRFTDYLFITAVKTKMLFLILEKSPPWSEEECKNFEHALQMYDKNFHLIQKHKVSLYDLF